MSNDCDNCKYEKLKLSEEPCRSCSCCDDENMKWAPKEEKDLNKNYVKDFMIDNGLKINVKFPIKTYCENDDVFYFDDDYILRDTNGDFKYELLIDLLTGVAAVQPQPFSSTNLPKEGEEIWVVTLNDVGNFSFYADSIGCFALVASGNAFHTKAEAEEAAPRIRKEQGMTK